MSFCAFGLLLALVLVVSGQYRTAPPFPEEYSANVLQWKWNAQGVNHSYVSTVYSSVAQARVRTDTLSQQEGASRVSRVAVSLLDYTQFPAVVLNTFSEADTVALNASCGVFKLPASGAFPPPPRANFLNDPASGSIFAGTFERPDLVPNGFVDAWTVIYPGPTSATFFFNARTSEYVGYDFQSPVLRTGVTTKLYNFVYGPLDARIFFVDPSKCKLQRSLGARP